MVKRCAIPWSGRAGRRSARDRRARRRRARDRRAAPAHEITLNTALAHATPSHKSISIHGVASIIAMVKRYAIPWCGRAGRRSARDRRAASSGRSVNTAGLSASRSKSPSHRVHEVAHPCVDGGANLHTLVWPCWAHPCWARPCWASPCSGPPCWASLCSGPQCCTRNRDHSQHSTRSRHSSHKSISIH